MAFSRAMTTGDDREIKAHLSRCDACAETWADMKRLIAMAGELPVAEPGPDRAEALRDAVLSKASTVPTFPPRRVALRWIGALAASVIIAMGGYLAWRASDSKPPREAMVRRATVHPRPGAEYLLVGAQPDEIVRLSRGTITVKVQPLEPGERFRVVTGDGEVSVKGTVFDVTATSDRLTSVNVFSGTVEVQTAKRRVVRVGAPERWTAPKETTADSENTREALHRDDAEEQLAAPTELPREKRRHVEGIPPPRERGPRGSASPPRERGSGRAAVPDRETPDAGRPKATAGEKTPEEAAFTRGWRALRHGSLDEAVAAFDETLALGGETPLAQDALYWQAIAYARKPDRANAIRALSRFIKRFPESPRRGEAAVILGWHYFDEGKLEAADRLFDSALNDAAPSVRESAIQGREAVEAKQRNP